MLVAADESVAVRHLPFRQRLGVHHVVVADDFVEREYVGGHGVDFIVGECFRLLLRHGPPHEIENGCGIGPIIADQFCWIAIGGINRNTAD